MSDRRHPWYRRARPGRVAVGAAVALLTVYAAALRADALVGRYGGVPGPAWARDGVQALAAIGTHLRPRTVRWKPDPTPYVGGDPINYLRYAREMRSFYQPHVREPVFLALVRTQLWLLDGHDIAVSTASAISSVLVVPATYLMGAAAFGPAVGLGAALAWAVELDSVSWAVDGWRDDTFTLFTVLTIWSLIQLARVRTPRRAVVAGVMAGLACLTRLSALSYVLPGLTWIVLEAPSGTRRATAGRAALALLVTAVVAGPYLVNCARATGDPFYAVNYHTTYYRAAEGLSASVHESALRFMARNAAAQPLAALDTASGGLFAWPFIGKWRGFRPWSPALAASLRVSAVLGLILMLWSPVGRLLLVILFASLVPYSLTWSLGGGGAWRFSEHVYPIYLVAAVECLRRAVALAWSLARRTTTVQAALPRRFWVRAAVVAVAGTLAWLAYLALPLLVAREALGQGSPVTVQADARHRLFLAGSWSRAHTTGAVTVRAATSAQAALRVLVPRPVACALTLRIDPVQGGSPRRSTLSVFFNRVPLATLDLAYDPSRIGTYRLEVPATIVHAGMNRIDLVAAGTVPAGTAGRDFTWLAGNQPVAFRFWYFRLEPLPLPAT